MSRNTSINLTDFHWTLQALDLLDDGLIVVDLNYNVCAWNQFMQSYSGILANKILNKNLFTIYKDLPQKWLKRKIEAAVVLNTRTFSSWETRPYIFPFKNFSPISGAIDFMYQDMTISPIKSLSGEISHVCLLIKDVSEIARSKQNLCDYNRELKLNNQLDDLTNLYNRGYWDRLFKKEFDKHKLFQIKATVVMLDIDHFKVINDTYGHAAGDEVLRELGKILNMLARNNDKVGRYGGEEFGVILPNTDSQGAMYFCERVRNKVMQTIVNYNEHKIKLTISLGIAELTMDEINQNEWLHKADLALYSSKKAGRNKTTIYTVS